MQFKARMCEKNYHKEKYKNCKMGIPSLINMRTLGSAKHSTNTMIGNNFATRRIIANSLLHEDLIPNCETDKIFSSLWLDDRQVIFGTKCKKLMVLDVLTKNIIQIPTLESRKRSIYLPYSPCGMHSIQVNPSKTLLVTGANSSENVAIYQLPSLEPVCVGENGHGDWVFDIVWLDDEFFATGGRDSKVSLWQISENRYEQQKQFPSHFYFQPTVSQKCHTADKIRALTFNKNYMELGALSINARIHLWDVCTFKQKQSRCLPFLTENVCLILHEKRNIFAVGSKAHVTFLDANTLLCNYEITTKQSGCSIRSLSFTGDILTIGTGNGTVLFYDIRAQNYISKAGPDDLPFSEYHVIPPEAKLVTSRGVIKQNQSFWDMYHGYSDYRPAIYTHSYDASGARLFLGGGPLPASLKGCYLGLWQ